MEHDPRPHHRKTRERTAEGERKSQFKCDDRPGKHRALRGPVEQARGFVLHSADYVRETTLVVSQEIALTASIDVLAAIASGQGPRRSLLALGYAGWDAGQLESEIQQNGWLQVSADEELLFGKNIANKWMKAIRKIGLDVSALSSESGHA